MRSQPGITWQPSLFGDEEPAVDREFKRLERIQLHELSWVDHAPGWLSWSDKLFHDIVETREWAQRSRRMYDREVLEPRLTSPWFLDSGEPLEPAIVEEMRQVLSARYDVEFDSSASTSTGTARTASPGTETAFARRSSSPSWCSFPSANLAVFS